MNSRALLESSFLVLISVFLYTAGMGIALMTLLAVLIIPSLFMIIERRYGARTAMLGVCLGTTLIFAAHGPVAAFIYMLELGILGVALGQLSGRSKSGVDFMLAAVLISVAAKVSLLMFSYIAAGVNLFYVSPEAAEGMTANIAAIMSKSGFNLSDEALRAYAAELSVTMSLRMPAMLIIFSVVDTFAAYLISSKAVKRFGGGKMAMLPPFGLWKFPKNVLLAFLAAALADTVHRVFPENRSFEMVAVNILELLRVLFFLEGLALCWYYMTAQGISRVFKVAVTTFCAVFWPVSFVLSSVGFFDIWFDLRRHIRRK